MLLLHGSAAHVIWFGAARSSSCPNAHDTNLAVQAVNGYRVEAVAAASEGAMKDFFISYNRKDKQWAEWIAWQLEEAGFSTVIQAWDFVGNWVIKMDQAMRGTTRTIAVLSPDYVKAVYTQPEWANAFRLDPTGEKDLLIPVRVVAFDPEGTFAQLVYVDLVGAEEDAAVERLLKRVRGERGKPTTRPTFPLSQSAGALHPPSPAAKPAYPASDSTQQAATEQKDKPAMALADNLEDGLPHDGGRAREQEGRKRVEEPNTRRRAVEEEQRAMVDSIQGGRDDRKRNSAKARRRIVIIGLAVLGILGFGVTIVIEMLEVYTPDPPPAVVVTYKFCVGEYRQRCPSDAIYQYCGFSAENWAAARCASHTTTNLGTFDGNKCGYSIDQVLCSLPK
jgi:hypothetical protein